MTIPAASAGRAPTRRTVRGMKPVPGSAWRALPPICHLFTLCPSSRTAAGVTSTAPIMLRKATTIAPTDEESSTDPGDRTRVTPMIAISTTPAKTAVRPAVLAASEAACRGCMPLSKASRKRVTISSE